MHGLIQRLALLARDIDLAERGRGQHAERAGQHRRDIGQHVAEQIVGHDDVELLRRLHQHHAAGIGELMFQRHVLVFARMHGRHDLVPEHARLHDVALFHRRHLVAALARQIEGDAADALDFIGVVNLRIDGALLAVAEIGDGLRLAEINAAGEFPHDHDVEAFDRLALQAGSIRQRRIADGRTQIGEQAEILAQAQQAGLGAHLIGHAVPLGSADGAEDDGVRGRGLGHVAFRDRHLVRVIGGTADQTLLGLE